MTAPTKTRTPRTPKTVENRQLHEGCEEIAKELEDITKGSVIFRTNDVKRMISWANNSITIQQQEIQKWFRNTNEHKIKRLNAELKLNQDLSIKSLLEDLLNAE